MYVYIYSQCAYHICLFTVTDVELKRLKDAFKRTSGLSAYMSQQCFYKEVLGDGVPPKVAEVNQSLLSRCLPHLPPKLHPLVSISPRASLPLYWFVTAANVLSIINFLPESSCP